MPAPDIKEGHQKCPPAVRGCDVSFVTSIGLKKFRVTDGAVMFRKRDRIIIWECY